MNRCLETLIVRLLNEMLFLARASLSLWRLAGNPQAARGQLGGALTRVDLRFVRPVGLVRVLFGHTLLITLLFLKINKNQIHFFFYIFDTLKAEKICDFERDRKFNIMILLIP